MGTFVSEPGANAAIERGILVVVVSVAWATLAEPSRRSCHKPAISSVTITSESSEGSVTDTEVIASEGSPRPSKGCVIISPAIKSASAVHVETNAARDSRCC